MKNSGSDTAAGVYTGEVDGSARTTAASTSVGAIVGAAVRGIVGKPTLVIDDEDYVRKFGVADNLVSYMGYCATAFLQDSSRLYVTRVAKNTRLGGVKIVTENNFCVAQSFTSGLEDPADVVFAATDILWLYGANPGAWNNDLRVLLYPDTNDPSNEGFVLSVFEGASTVAAETYRGTLFDKLDGYGEQLNIVNQLEEKSSRVRANVNEDHPSLVNNPRTRLINAICPGVFAQGHNGDAIDESDIINAWDEYDDKETITVNILINAGYTDVSIQHRMLEVCQQRDDCFAVLDVPRNVQEAQDAVNWRRTVLNANTSYGALYAPDLIVRDTNKARNLIIPCSGHVAGVFARTDRVSAAWFAPAGITRGQLNVIGLHKDYELGHRNMFAENQINPIVAKPGNGIVVWGADTLQSHASALSNINVRRLVSLLKTSIASSTEIGIYEPNDSFLRNEMIGLCEDILEPILRGRGLYWYTVICDERNNSNEDIANGDLILDVYVDPVLPAKRIHLNAIIPKTGEIKFAVELTQQTAAA